MTQFRSIAAARRVSRGRLSLALACSLLMAGGSVSAVRLPLRTYTAADGLASDNIFRIVQDRKGFLWFCTGEGLSRFDGTRFVTYGNGSAGFRGQVEDLVEDAGGRLWIAVGDTLYRRDPDGTADFRRVPPAGDPLGFVYDLETTPGGVWAAAESGLFRISLEDPSAGPARVPALPSGIRAYVLAHEDNSRLWVGTEKGLWRFDGARWSHYTTSDGLPHASVRSLLSSRSGDLWVGTARGVCRIEAKSIGANVRCEVPEATRTLAGWIVRLFEDRDARLWIVSTESGLASWIPGSGAPRRYDRSSGIPGAELRALAEDAAGNLWIGSNGGGAVRIARGGLDSYGVEDGLRSSRIGSILDARAGERIVVTSGSWLHRLVGDRLHGFRPLFPSRIDYRGWGWGQILAEDEGGVWWVPTGRGLCRYPPVTRFEELARTPPDAIYTREDGLGGDDVFRLYRDAHGDLWISTNDAASPMLTRRDHRTGTFRRFGPAEGLPLDSAPTAFAEAGGFLWVGFYGGQLGRLSGNRFVRVRLPGEDAESSIQDLHLDAAGRLWVATSHRGVLRIDDPAADPVRAVAVTRADGLSSNHVRCITEDRAGRIYLGTRSGLDRLDPASGRVRRYTLNDGLPNSYVNVCHADPQGILWFGTLEGLARLDPTAEAPLPPPPVFLRGLAVSGVERWPAGTVAVHARAFEVPASARQVELRFGGLQFNAGAFLRYQYRLDGRGPWSPPAEQRSVLLAGLAPGRYEFQVRAVNADGVFSTEPASLPFTVLRPWWRRGWFLGLAGLAVALLAVGAHRMRLARAVALERQRIRIAMDLHDEVGSGLGSIGLLADMAGDRSLDEARRAELTEQIAEAAAELGTALGEIVGTLRPGADTVESLARQLAECGHRFFPGERIRFTTRFPDDWPATSLTPAVRRNAFLIGLEALHNAARHSGARNVRLGISRTARRWSLEVIDDGEGIPSRTAEGLGLESMRRRAREIGGRLEVAPAPGGGTRVALRFDAAGRPQRRRVI